jgi:hypothetical protein
MGIQITAPVHREMDCLQLAFAYQEARKTSSREYRRCSRRLRVPRQTN